MDNLQIIQVKPPPCEDSDGSPKEDAPPLAKEKKPSELLIHQTVEDHKANRELRQEYASKAHGLALGCISFWMIVVCVCGTFNAVVGRQPLSDSVLIAITTGVTINVLAAFLGVIRGLFPAEKKSTSKTKNRK